MYYREKYIYHNLKSFHMIQHRRNTFNVISKYTVLT